MPKSPVASDQIPEPIMVTRSGLESRLRDVERAVDNPLHGLYGPQSMMWRVNRESIVFLGAGRALLLQLAHPFVAQSIEDHSPVKRDPWGRYYRTMPPVFAMVFGSLDQAFEQARAIYQIHERIHGVLPQSVGAFPEGCTYHATEAHAALWVHATLWHTALLCHETVLGPLTAPERDRYYDESARFAALFGIPDTLVPHDARSFETYFDDMVTSEILAVGPAGHNIASYFFGTARDSFGRFLPAWYRAVTAQLLPEGLREGFQLPYGAREQASAERALRRIRRMYSLMPERLRFVGPYQEAASRIEGRSRPALWTRAMNMFWLGQSALGR